MKGIYSFYLYCGRSGSLDATFIASAEDVAEIIGKQVYFGEVLGKHSEVNHRIQGGDICLLTDDQAFIETFEEILGEGWSTGHNPFEYYEFADEDEEDEE